MIGAQIDRWVIDEERGRGSMGCVYKAHAAADPSEVVAVKLIAAELSNSPEFRDRFQREIDVLRQLSHPNVVKYLDSGVHDGAPYYVMEYVDGPDLDSLLARESKRRMPWPEVLKLALRAVPALKHVHDRGVIHRDLKPSNFLVAADGTVKLGDFGVAKLFHRSPQSLAASMVGNVAYLAPECSTGKPATKRSDFYALGGVLYTLLAGRPPFTARNVVELLHKHCFTQPDRPAQYAPDLPAEFDDLVMRLLAKDPADRPGDGGVLYQELDSLRLKLRRKGVLAEDIPPADMEPGKPDPVAELERWRGRPEGLPDPHRRPKAWHERAWVLATLLALCVGGIAWGLLRPGPSAADLFTRAEPLMASDDPADWDRAWSAYLEPMTLRHPDHPYQEQVRDFRERIRDRSDYDWAMTIARKRKTPDHGEAERVYRQGLRLCQAGDLRGARQAWGRLVAAFEGVESEDRWVRQARRGLADLDAIAPTAEVKAGRADPVFRALDRARQLAADGKRAEAEAVWKAVEELYDGDPAGADILERVRRDRGS